MGYKTMAVHCDASHAAAHRLALAVGLARRFDAHLVALYPRPQFEPHMLFDGGSAMGRYSAVFEENAEVDRAVALAPSTTGSRALRSRVSGVLSTACPTPRLSRRRMAPTSPCWAKQVPVQPALCPRLRISWSGARFLPQARS